MSKIRITVRMSMKEKEKGEITNYPWELNEKDIEIMLLAEWDRRFGFLPGYEYELHDVVIVKNKEKEATTCTSQEV